MTVVTVFSTQKFDCCLFIKVHCVIRYFLHFSKKGKPIKLEMLTNMYRTKRVGVEE